MTLAQVAPQRGAPPAVEVRLPRCWSPMLSAPVGAGVITRVVTPRFDCRAAEAALAMAMATAGRAGGDVWLVASEVGVERVEHAWRTWAERRGLGRQRGQALELAAGGTVWLRQPPVPVLSGAVVADAHSVPRDVVGERLQAVDGPVVVIGHALPRGHWARDLAPKAVALDPSEALACFPDQARAAAEPGASSVDEEDVARTPFLRFSRTRLKVRSDKTATFLTEAQREEARRQLGDGWHTGRSGTPTLSFQLSPMQRRYLAAKRAAVRAGRPARFLLLKYRRGGFTTLEQALSYYECATAPSVECATLAHTRDDTARIFEITTRFLENDPDAPARVDDGRSKITLANGSSIFTGTAGGKGFARGATLRRVHGSEVAQWCLGPNQARQVDTLIAGLIGAASNGEVVLESTPNGVEWFCNTYRAAKRGLNDWTPIFLPWFQDAANHALPGTYSEQEILQTLSDEERELVARHGLTIPQLAWRRAAMKQYGRLFKQEFPEDDESCFITSGTCYFNVQALTTLVRTLPRPVSVVERRGYRETRWEQPEPNVQYCAGCDTSEGIPGCDPNGVGVLRRDNGKQVASVHGYLSPAALAEVAAKLCTEYNGALLGVERENHGHAVLQKLRDIGFDRPHFFGGPLYYFHQGSDVDASRPGWDTNSESRPRMLAELAEAVESSIELGRTRWVSDPDFVSECLAFRLQPDGKFRADPGAHDDSVMKWAIAWQMRLARIVRPTASMV